MKDYALTEREAMVRALALALEGWGRVAPNPLVGAVLLRDGKMIAEGAHREFGGPHAEVEALVRAGEAARGATCVVNLEPCAHHGKTPPCVDALCSAGVSRVVLAMRDPNPAAAGGVEQLREAGVVVEGGMLEDRARALNAPFLWSQVRPERPFVALKLATSLDGFLADATGRSQWISGSEARDFVHWLRAGFDAIAVGRRTAERDDPQLTVRGSVEARLSPVRVVVSKAGAVRPDLKLVRTAREIPTVLWTTAAGLAHAEIALAGSGVSLLVAESLEAGLHSLREREVRSVLVEGGGSLARALLEAGLVDRLYWVQAPIWLGVGVPAFQGLVGSSLEEASRWVVTERRALGDDTLLMVDRKLCSPAS